MTAGPKTDEMLKVKFTYLRQHGMTETKLAYLAYLRQRGLQPMFERPGEHPKHAMRQICSADAVVHFASGKRSVGRFDYWSGWVIEDPMQAVEDYEDETGDKAIGWTTADV